MKTAVCDDEKLAAEQMARLIGNCPQCQEVESDVYTDFGLLLQTVKKGRKYDIVFMDIEWNAGKTGIDYAEELFKADMEIQIVFITAYAEFSQDVFLRRINLGGLLLKPVEQEKLNYLSEILECRRKKYEARVLNVLSDRKSLKVAIDWILYIESNLHQCLIHTNQENIRCSEKITELIKRMPTNFQLCHKSFLVNMDRIYKLEKGKVCLDNGEYLTISRAQSEKFMESFFIYIGKKDEWEY